jgi:hypothetical protein
MEARWKRAALLAAVLLVSLGARHRSANFIVETPDPKLAAQIAEAAEKYRRDLAIEWVGKAMPNWAQPCPMTVQVGANLGAGGATTFVFDHGEVFGWRMSIQGSVERIFDSVLPHEITHMIFASHFRRPLPRWADEGGATSVECTSERMKHRQMLFQFLSTGRGIAFNQMFAMKDYPRDVMPLYAQGYSLSEFLIQTGGRRKYVDFLGEGLESGNWSAAVQHHYGIADLGGLQTTWLAWVRQGSPQLKPQPSQPAAAPSPELLAAAPRRPRPEPNLIWHVRDKEQHVARGELVPVVYPEEKRTNPHSGATTPPSIAASPETTSVAAVPRTEPKALPASGWHAAGTPVPSPPPAPLTAAAGPPATDPFQAQVTRPQPIERPRQTILEWSRP